MFCNLNIFAKDEEEEGGGTGRLHLPSTSCAYCGIHDPSTLGNNAPKYDPLKIQNYFRVNLNFLNSLLNRITCSNLQKRIFKKSGFLDAKLLYKSPFSSLTDWLTYNSLTSRHPHKKKGKEKSSQDIDLKFAIPYQFTFLGYLINFY